MKHRVVKKTIIIFITSLLMINLGMNNTLQNPHYIMAEGVPRASGVKKYDKLFLCGSLDKQTENLIKWDIDNVATYQPDGMNLVLRTIYDPESNTFSLSQSLESFYDTYQYALSLGIPTRMIRVSASRYNFTYLDDTMMEDWMSFYLPLVQQVVDLFKGQNIPFFCVMNETDACYCDARYDYFTMECIEIAKKAGFQVGISCSGTEEIFHVSERVCGLLDFVGVNIYPKIGYEGNYTDYQKWIEIMNQYKNKINRIIVNKGKPVFITEIGIPDSWECQSKITYYNKGTLSHGILPATFWTAFFESGLGEECIGTSMWFWECSKDYENVKRIIKEYRQEK